MKKSFFAAILLSSITFASCSDNSGKHADGTNESHEGMDHCNTDQAATETTVVVETPDYTSVAAPVKEQIATLVDSYLKLKDALVETNAETAKKEAQEVLAAAQKVDVSALEGDQKSFAEEKLEEVKQSATKMTEASDVNAQRNNLELLSEATFSLTKAFGATDKKLYYQHCPMANNDQGAYWLSSDNEIRNPYFGDKMLECGSTEEVLN